MDGVVNPPAPSPESLSPGYRFFLEPEPCPVCGPIGHWKARIFVYDPKDVTGPHMGMPQKNWIWACFAQQTRNVFILSLAQSRPPEGANHGLKQLLRNHGGEWVGWERSDRRGERVKLFQL